MADIQPFRAVRYAGAAGALADLVAPPYDAVDDDERAALYTRSPYNVIHVTLPESAGEAGRLYREWLAQGVLSRTPGLRCGLRWRSSSARTASRASAAA